ncbi:MAG TPA: hypothetical protein VL326_14400 [Kofleriaceae bacterium]|nr:hypothetical protein [Kofleriaceae bacterium]
MHRLIPLLFVAGCLLESGKADDSRSGFHDVTVKWHLRKLDGSLMAACPAGFTTLYTHLYRLGYVEPPDALVETPCTPEGSLTQKLATAGDLIDESTRDQDAHGYYDYHPEKDIWIDVSEETGRVNAASSFLMHTELKADMTIDFDIVPEGGVGVAAWQLISKGTMAPMASCASAGVDEIEYATRSYNSSDPLVVGGSWPCTQIDPFFYYDPDGNSTLPDADAFQLGTGHTRALAPDSYYVELRAKRAGVVVGKSLDASFYSMDKNEAHKINGAQIIIDDR